MEDRITEELSVLNLKDGERYDRDAFYFLTAILLIIVVVVLFDTEIIKFLLSKLF